MTGVQTCALPICHVTITPIWTCWTSHSKTMGINIELAPLCCYSSLQSSGKFFWVFPQSVYMGICDHSVRQTFVMLHEKAWLAINVPIDPKGGWGLDITQAIGVLPHQTCQSMFLWTSLCAQGHSKAGTGKGLPLTTATKLKAYNGLKCLYMYVYSAVK